MAPSRRKVFAVALFGAALLGGAGAWGQEVYHDNVVILLDASGSMKESMRATGTNKMTAAKAALKEVLNQVPETTRIGLLVFSGRNLKQPWAYQLGPRDDAALTRAIELPQPGGGTPLGQYMKMAADRLLQERQKQLGYGTYRLLVVTDGAAQDQQLVDRNTPEIMARGITIDVIGVDMKQTHTLATKVHSYRRADDPQSLKQAIAEVFAEVGSADGDAAQAEAFDLIAPLPYEVASGMIKALATSGNTPIGVKAGQPAQARQQAQQQKRQQPPQVPQSQSQPRPGKSSSKGVFGLPWAVIILVIIGLAIVRGGSGRRRRGR
jgi:uncharacterized protein YegL